MGQIGLSSKIEKRARTAAVMGQKVGWKPVNRYEVGSWVVLLIVLVGLLLVIQGVYVALPQVVVRTVAVALTIYVLMEEVSRRSEV